MVRKDKCLCGEAKTNIQRPIKRGGFDLKRGVPV